MLLSDKVGCTKNIKLLSPKLLALTNRCAGRQGVPSKAFSKYTSEHEPLKQGTFNALISA
jgi:hypothetical protein